MYVGKLAFACDVVWMWMAMLMLMATHHISDPGQLQLLLSIANAFQMLYVVFCICMFMYRGMYGFMPGLPCIPQKVNASTRMHLKRNVKVFNQWQWKASAHRPGQQLYQYSSPAPHPLAWSL